MMVHLIFSLNLFEYLLFPSDKKYASSTIFAKNRKSQKLKNKVMLKRVQHDLIFLAFPTNNLHIAAKKLYFFRNMRYFS